MPNQLFGNFYKRDLFSSDCCIKQNASDKPLILHIWSRIRHGKTPRAVSVDYHLLGALIGDDRSKQCKQCTWPYCLLPWVLIKKITGTIPTAVMVTRIADTCSHNRGVSGNTVVFRRLSAHVTGVTWNVIDGEEEPAFLAQKKKPRWLNSKRRSDGKNSWRFKGEWPPRNK